MSECLMQENIVLSQTTIKVCTDPSEIEEFQKLIWQIYCQNLNWLDSDDFPEGIIKDRYDSYGSFILIHKSGKLIGGTRLVRDSLFGFPHEKSLGFSLPDSSAETDARVKEKLRCLGRQNIMEITRTIGVSRKNMITKDVVKALYWFGIRNGVKAYFMVIDMDFFSLCHKIHVPIHPISTSGFIEGSWTVPGILFVDEIKSQIEIKDPGFWDYIRKQDNLSGDWLLA